ncbi:MAG: hypothetical protein MZV70_30940 [Desulfobacterales bacterium]|nr:hypothetical protein [Desulfobacterales bacterium]
MRDRGVLLQQSARRILQPSRDQLRPPPATLQMADGHCCGHTDLAGFLSLNSMHAGRTARIVTSRSTIARRRAEVSAPKWQYTRS